MCRWHQKQKNENCHCYVFNFRYVQENISRTSKHRAYNSHIPGWLVNRPMRVIKHCNEKLDIVIDADNIKITNTLVEATQSYKVGSFQGGKTYNVVINSDAPFPSCDCKDWKRTFLPCKHMIAIFHQEQHVNWHSFPER